MMFILAKFLQALALFVSIFFSVMYFALVVRVIMSWTGADPYYNEITRIVYSVTDPLLAPFRRLPLTIGPVDLSPILVFLLLALLRNFLVGVLYQLAGRL